MDRSGCVWAGVTGRQEEISITSLPSETSFDAFDDLDSFTTAIIAWMSDGTHQSIPLKWRCRIESIGKGLVQELVAAVDALHAAQSNIVTTTVEHKAIVVGDIHGQEWNLRSILAKNGLPSTMTKYIFNGDIVDRGPASIECILIIFALKYRYPGYVFINRGNHESVPINNENGFRREARMRLGLDTYDTFSRCFLTLPLGVILESRIEGRNGGTCRFLVLHGGIATREDGQPAALEELQAIHRTSEPCRDTSLLTQVLWNDPCAGEGNQQSKRHGWGLQFGAEATAQFLRENRVSGLVRSHEEIAAPFRVTHAHCLTVFSAIAYRARYLEISANATPMLWTLRPDIEGDDDLDQFLWLGFGPDDPDLVPA